MLKNKNLILIFLLALFLRTYKLGDVPYGFHADEVRVGWNAFSILKTGKDDRGNKLALYYNTFGDFRPTGIFYLTTPSIAILRKSVFAVRFPSAFFGALTIFPLYLLVNEIEKRKNLGFLASFLFAISPWHLSVSRATSEVVISLFLTLTGIYLILKFLNRGKSRYLIVSILFLAVSYFFYHSVRLLLPIYIISIIIFFWQRIKNKKTAIFTFITFCLITVFFASSKEAGARFSQISIFNDLDVKYELDRMPFEEGQNHVFVARLFHNKPSVYMRRFINEYANYFSPGFLVGETAKPLRYKSPGVGLLTFVELVIFVFGLVAIAQKKFCPLALILLLASPIPASLTTEDAPNLHRALFMIPFILIIGTYGFDLLSKNLKALTFAFLLLNFIFFLHMYLVHTKMNKPLYRNFGAKELAVEINKIQNNYDKIILTNIPDDPYPWIAFFSGRDPERFNKDAIKREKGVWSTENFVFSSLRCPSRDAFEKPDVKRLLVVDAEGCATESKLRDRSDVKLIDRILRPDESEVYILWSRVE